MTGLLSTSSVAVSTEDFDGFALDDDEFVSDGMSQNRFLTQDLFPSTLFINSLNSSGNSTLNESQSVIRLRFCLASSS